MMVIRPVTMNDLEDIHELAGLTGSGLTTLPHNRDHLKSKIEDSLHAFSKTEGKPMDECYLFVLEDTETGKVVGTSGVVAAVGTRRPFYTYKLNTEVHYSKSLDIYRKNEFLTLTNDMTGCAEICTLFLSPHYRGGGNGMLLSKSRFLFMAQFRERFSKKVVAEMRGYSDENGVSPFWECVGRHFFGMDFDTADKTNGEGNSQFIAELMPHHPIYIPLLSEEAQKVIGQVHPQTRPAVAMLKAEGFTYNGYVDIFDAGPTIEAWVDEINTVKQSVLAKVRIGDSDADEGQYAMLSNCKLAEFRACLSKQAEIHDGEITLDEQTARMLHVEEGEQVRIRYY